MILSAQTLRMRGMISPWMERTQFDSQYGPLTYGCGPAGYDVRVEDEYYIAPNMFFLASTFEHFRMDHDVLGVVHDKSTWIRRGLAVHNTVIEPGWRGHLTLEIKNVGNDYLTLERGAPIAQIVFHMVDRVTTGYNGKYQDQPRGPQGAK